MGFMSVEIEKEIWELPRNESGYHFGEEIQKYSEVFFSLA